MSGRLSFHFDDSSSSEEDTEVEERLAELKKPKKLFSKLTDVFKRPISVQSGDIVRSPTPQGTSNGSVYQIVSSTSTNNTSCDQSQSAGGSVNGSERESVVSSKHSEGFLASVFRKGIRVGFYSFKLKCCTIPIVSITTLVLNLVVVGIIVGAMMKTLPPQINLNIEAFQIPSHPSKIHYDAFLAAKGNLFSNGSAPADVSDGNQLKRKRRSSNDDEAGTGVVPRSVVPRSQQDAFPNCPTIAGYTQTRRHRYWMLDLVFRVPSSNPDKNILTLDRIRYIHKVEETLRNTSEYKYFCLMSNGYLCDPLVSLLTWFYQTDHQNGQYISTYNPDSPGYDTAPVISQHKKQAQWFTGAGLTTKNSSYYAELLRSQLRIGVPLRCFSSTNSEFLSQQQAYVTDYLVSLIPILERMSNSEVEILYGGSNIFDYEYTQAIIHDAVLASISGALILVLVIILTGFSLWLTLGGIYSILSCFVLAYFVYRAVLGIESVGILNVISIFVIIGIGVDDVFVFINTFKQSKGLSNMATLEDRLVYTVREATKATFFTSITTSIAFFANAISSIPAIQQFGIFMGVVVLLCFVQVFLVIPHFLVIWEVAILPLQKTLLWPVRRLCFRHRSSSGRREASSLQFSVRMSDIPEMDSGISSVTGSDNSSNDSTEVDSGGGYEGTKEDEVALVVGGHSPVARGASPRTSAAVSRLTLLMQKFMFGISVVVMVFHIWPKFSSKRGERVRWWVNFLLFCLGYVVLLVVSVGLLSRLRPSDKPPQFFSPDTNLQKVLDLTGNVTDASVVDGYSMSEWASSSTHTPSDNGGSPTSGPNNGGGNNSPSPNPNPGSHSTNPPPATQPPQHTRPPTKATPSAPPRTSTPRVAHPTTSKPHPPHTQSPPSTPNVPPPNPPNTDLPPPPPITRGPINPTSATPSSGGASVGGGGGNNKYVNNAVVYVVLGVESVERHYDPTHVLPEEGEQVSAILDHKFSNTFSCLGSSPSSPAKLKGAIRALCRLCTNISNPDNDLILPGNYECFPSAAQGSTSQSFLSCIMSVAAEVQECQSLVVQQLAASQGGGASSNVSVNALASVQDEVEVGRAGSVLQLRYLAMAFRSTTNIGNSPLSSLGDYHKWEQFLSAEMSSIKSQSGPGQTYEGSEALSSAFQTSDYWVRVNIENAAVSGSIYGIIVSFLLCSFVVVLLSHDFRLVLSMVVTILAILCTLCAFFYVFGWTLGIVEAISLSILVGNSLDYCIHLSEAFISMDDRHIGFVDKFKFARSLPPRVKRVMAAISYIGVSIFSSAITTILAIIPLLATEIQLFARFGQILLLDTLVAIIFTLVICSNCLAFFGPPRGESKKKKWANGVTTVVVTCVGYVILFLGLYIASRQGVNIPSPQGGQLF